MLVAFIQQVGEATTLTPKVANTKFWLLQEQRSAMTEYLKNKLKRKQCPNCGQLGRFNLIKS